MFLTERRRSPLLALLFDYSILDQTVSPILIPILVLGISFAGSWHCAAMCGGLTAVIAPKKRSMIFYQIGRLCSYEILGIIFALFGKYTLSNTLSGVLPFFVSLLLGFSFIKIGISSFKKKSQPLSTFFSKIYSKLARKTLAKVDSSSVNWNGFKIGLLSVFLPCGWLYSFILAAVMTQNIYYSMILLFFFWLGSIPALSIAPIFFRKLLEPISKKFPKFSAVVLIGIGLLTIGMKIYPVFYPGENKNAAFCLIKH